MNLTEYEKAVIRSWSLDHVQRARGQKSIPIKVLIDEAAKISGFIMGAPEAEIVPIGKKESDIVEGGGQLDGNS